MKFLSTLEREASGNNFKRNFGGGYAGAKQGNHTADWLTSNKTADEILRWQLDKIRARSRDLFRNNDYAKAFARHLRTNVVGPTGIALKSKVKNAAGTLDKKANEKIEDAWRRWSKRQNASVSTTLSWRELQWMHIESIARDGEVFIRKVKGYDNKFRFSLQTIEPDHLDVNYNRKLQNGNEIRMSIEFNAWKKPVAYHVTVKHPGDGSYIVEGMNKIRIPAEEMIHYFVKERDSQSRGVPWLHTAIIRLRMLGGYEEAALICARVGASKMGIYTQQEGAQQYTGDETDDKGNPIDKVEPGMIDIAPKGYIFQTFDPTYPHSQFEPFVKAVLRGASAGMGILYNNLANDLEGVSFSSIRQGTLAERDFYKILQAHMSENVHDEIYYPDWLEAGLLTQEIKLPAERIEKFNAATWRPRGWDWVDPLKDMKSATEGVNNRLNSRTRILSERGVDFYDLLDEIEEEENAMRERGIEFKLADPPDGESDEEENIDDDDKNDKKNNKED